MLVEHARQQGIYVENPHLMVPQRIVEGQTDIKVVSFPPLYPPRDVFSEELLREPYIPVPLATLRELFPSSAGEKTAIVAPTEQKAEVPSMNFAIESVAQEKDSGPLDVLSSLGVVLILGSDAQAFKGKTSNRPMQRGLQYELLINALDEREKDGFVVFSKIESSDVFRISKQTVQRILATWYEHELSQEPFTKAIADGKNETRLPNPQANLAAAEEIIRDHHLPQPEVVLHTAEGIVRQNQLIEDEIVAAAEAFLEKYKAAKAEKPIEKTAESLKEEEEKLREHDAKKTEENAALSTEASLRNIENQENVEQAAKNRESGDAQVHNASLDLPPVGKSQWVDVVAFMNQKF